MDSVQTKTFLSLLPRIPLVLRVALLHVLRLSKQSRYVDLRTALTIAVIRSFIKTSQPRSISSTQRLFLGDPGVKGRIWVSRYTAPVPPDDAHGGVRDVLGRAIQALGGHDGSRAGFHVPELAPVEAEWTGYRPGVARNSALEVTSDKDTFDRMMQDCASGGPTVLYLHGGAYWLMDPATHRPTCKRLAKMTGGRCYSVRYRLAPKHAFPSALMDALVSYLTLLYPPPEAFHQPVEARSIVFAGDSAGGNLCLALLQTILEIRRQRLRIGWHGGDRDVPLPGGVAVSSPWMDMTSALPSCTRNGPFDYLPAMSGAGAYELNLRLPVCELWPTQPPRASLYADDELLCHPLVTPLLARSWRGAPPVYLSTGWELLADEDKYTAARLYRDGVAVRFEEYEGMPHCFAMIFTDLAESRRAFRGWAGFIRDVVREPAKMQSGFVMVKAKTLEEVELDPAALSPYTEADVEKMVAEVVKEGVSLARL